jgi:hypothetical protein
MTMTLKEEGMQAIIEGQDSLIRELSKEIRALSVKNLKLKMHMQVLIGLPNCEAAKKIRERFVYG